VGYIILRVDTKVTWNNASQSQYLNMSNTHINKRLYTRQRTQLEDGGDGDTKGATCTWILSTGMWGQRVTRSETCTIDERQGQEMISSRIY